MAQNDLTLGKRYLSIILCIGKWNKMAPFCKVASTNHTSKKYKPAGPIRKRCIYFKFCCYSCVRQRQGIWRVAKCTCFLTFAGQGSKGGDYTSIYVHSQMRLRSCAWVIVRTCGCLRDKPQGLTSECLAELR